MARETEERRLAAVPCRTDFLFQILHSSCKWTNLPIDAKVVGIYQKESIYAGPIDVSHIYLVVESSEFEPVPEAEELPEFRVEYSDGADCPEGMRCMFG